jgi:hypothetical protein
MVTRVINVRHTKVYDLFIGRPSALGSPFVIGRDGDRAVCLAKYIYTFAQYPIGSRIAAKLRGRTLGCYCTPLPCHGHFLARVADGIWDPDLNPRIDETIDDYVRRLCQTPKWPQLLLPPARS